MRRPQVTIDHFFVSVCRIIREVFIHLGDGWRQSGQRESDTTDEHRFVGFLGKLPAFLVQAFPDKGIDWIASAGNLRRYWSVADGQKRPVLLILGTLFDPLLEFGNFLRAEFLVTFSGRHVQIRIVGIHPFPQLAIGHVARDDGSIAIMIGSSPLERIEPESGFPFLFIETVASEAFVRKDRSDVAVEANGFVGRRERERDC